MSDSLPMPISTLTRAQRSSIMNLVRRAARNELRFLWAMHLFMAAFWSRHVLLK